MLSDSTRVFTILLIVIGVRSIADTGGRGVQVLFETQLFGKVDMSKISGGLKEHFIVCGYGKMGKYICEELTEKGQPFVVVENDPEKVESLSELGYLFVRGDATSDDTLTEAGVEKARGLVAVPATDAGNVFTTLSAKALSQKIFVVARAVEEETEPKLLKAGANCVVKPYETAGTKMAELLLRPGVIDFIDVIARDKKVDLNIEEVHLSDASRFHKQDAGGFQPATGPHYHDRDDYKARRQAHLQSPVHILVGSRRQADCTRREGEPGSSQQIGYRRIGSCFFSSPTHHITFPQTFRGILT